MRSTKIIIAAALLMGGAVVHAQDTASSRALTMDEYEKAKTFAVADPDKDTYLKIENTYILDHNGFGKPYFITGDDGKRKRIDLYKLSGRVVGDPHARRADRHPSGLAAKRDDHLRTRPEIDA